MEMTHPTADDPQFTADDPPTADDPLPPEEEKQVEDEGKWMGVVLIVWGVVLIASCQGLSPCIDSIRFHLLYLNHEVGSCMVLYWVGALAVFG